MCSIWQVCQEGIPNTADFFRSVEHFVSDEKIRRLVAPESRNRFEKIEPFADGCRQCFTLGEVTGGTDFPIPSFSRMLFQADPASRPLAKDLTEDTFLQIA